jgi:shikimate dehydrogenase
MTNARTRLFALLGRPVAHSLSPAMHNAAFRALGLDAVYLALECAEERVEPLMVALAEAGGGGNITIPHKRAAAAVVGPARLEDTGACNTFWGADGNLVGANTDPAGILHALDRLGVDGGRWLVVGTGGSARAVAAAALTAGAALAVRSRTAAHAAALSEHAARSGVPVVHPAECDVVINATPLGMRPEDPAPLSLADVPAARVVLDLVYTAGATALVRIARARGLTAEDGREVLLGQGVAAFRLWFPALDPPVEVMRAALRVGLD